MLKIDNVDLKELKKFGFKKHKYEIIYDHDDEIFIIGEYDSADHDLSVDMTHKVMNKIAYINGWGNWDWKNISLRRRK